MVVQHQPNYLILTIAQSAKEGAKAAPILHDSLLTPPDGHHFTNQPNVGTLARHGGYPSSCVTDGFLFCITATPE
jgi:hypothetical protein